VAVTHHQLAFGQDFSGLGLVDDPSPVHPDPRFNLIARPTPSDRRQEAGVCPERRSGSVGQPHRVQVVGVGVSPHQDAACGWLSKAKADHIREGRSGNALARMRSKRHSREPAMLRALAEDHAAEPAGDDPVTILARLATALAKARGMPLAA
jgi:hypothetical protein